MSEQEFNQRSEILQNFLEINSRRSGRATGFVKRASKLTSPLFVEILTLGLQEKGEATLNELVQVGAKLGVNISESGLVQRMNEAGGNLLRSLVQQGMAELSERAGVPQGVLTTFSAVNIVDSTQISLPSQWAGHIAGSGGSGSSAGVKVQVSYEYLTGKFNALAVSSGRVSDHACDFPVAYSQPNHLTLFDLGYFNQVSLGSIASGGGFFLTRLNTQTNVYWQTTDPDKADLLAYLEADPRLCGEVPVYVGVVTRLAVRLLFQKLPPAQVAERHRRAIHTATQKGKSCSALALRWLTWRVCITNVPGPRLSAHQALLLYSLRWHIDILFKLWKSHAKFATVRCHKVDSFVCLLYARLLGFIIFHWLIAPLRFVTTPELSLTRAFHVFQRALPRLIWAIAHHWTFVPRCLALLARDLVRFARQSSRSKLPSTRQRLAHAGL